MSNSKTLSDWDRLYLWHPFTQMQDWLGSDQLIIERGRGAYLYDTRGKKYLDGVSSLWVTVHGHRKKEIDRAIKEQLGKIAHSTLLGLGNVPAIELAKKLVEITPRGLSKVFYSDNGSTAVEIALKIAFQYWQQINQNPKSEILNKLKIRNPKLKTKFLTLVNAYHGDTVGAVSVGGIDLFHKMYKPLLFKAFKSPSPYCYRCAQRCKEPRRLAAGSAPCLIGLEKIMKFHHREIAAMIVEPMVQAAAGMLTMPKGYLKAVRQLCSKYNILLICDEVATGFGRTGKMFACEIEGISPDIMCVAKGLTGGYLPIAATLTTDRIYRAFLGKFEDKKTFFHGHTYTGNPLGCAAALASLKLFRKEQLLTKVGRNIRYLEKELEKFYRLEHVGDIRRCGMMVGIELVKDRVTKEEYPYKERIGHQVILEARSKGVLLRPLGDVIVLMPPLGITSGELEKLLRVAYNSIRKITGKK
jgi:adenosylmethionine-8-amino-7-oxononanoate transaminase